MNNLVDALRSNWRGVTIEPGLSEAELAELEEDYGICFPPDLAALLRHALPTGGNFPDWRGRSSAGKHVSLEERLSWPLEHILDSVENYQFWLPSWGRRPEQPHQALARAKEIADSAPKLIPVHEHSYLPTEPSQTGNPVFSVVGIDVVRYGDDLAEYFWGEFRVPLPASKVVSIHSFTEFALSLGRTVPLSVSKSKVVSTPRRIPFWDDMEDDGNQQFPT